MFNFKLSDKYKNDKQSCNGCDQSILDLILSGTITGDDVVIIQPHITENITIKINMIFSKLSDINNDIL